MPMMEQRSIKGIHFNKKFKTLIRTKTMMDGTRQSKNVDPTKKNFHGQYT